MGQFKFSNPYSELDSRSVFANNVCRLLVEKHGGIFDDAVDDLEETYNHFEEHVRNIYELISSEIPLFALYDLKRYGADNWSFTQTEYEEALTRANVACYEYYVE